MADNPHDVPLSPAQRSKIRRLSQWEPPPPGEEAGELNIIPYLDIMMNIIVFVIATISVVFMSTIDTQPPSAGGGGKTRNLRSKALNLTALVTTDGISLKTSSGNISTGCNSIGSGVTVPKQANGEHDFTELTRCAPRAQKAERALCRRDPGHHHGEPRHRISGHHQHDGCVPPRSGRRALP